MIQVINLSTADMPTHNLMSNVMVSNSRGIKPEVGMGATLCYYTDRHAGTIVEVHTNKNMIVVQQDTAIRTDSYGMSDSQDYRYERNVTGPLYWFRWNAKKSRWDNVYLNTETNRFKLSGSTPSLIVGRRDEFYDYSF